MGSEARISVASAVKYQDRSGKKFVRVSLRYASKELKELANLKISAEDLFPLDFMKEIKDVYVSLLSEGKIISDPYEKTDRLAAHRDRARRHLPAAQGRREPRHQRLLFGQDRDDLGLPPEGRQRQHGHGQLGPVLPGGRPREHGDLRPVAREVQRRGQRLQARGRQPAAADHLRVQRPGDERPPVPDQVHRGRHQPQAPAQALPAQEPGREGRPRQAASEFFVLALGQRPDPEAPRHRGGRRRGRGGRARRHRRASRPGRSSSSSSPAACPRSRSRPSTSITRSRSATRSPWT
ncbi:MAG: hypothetical protein MZV63_65120 [Marinilabiliales bacterium]|nr:hypothetical protein [Marinilabiliales bacterium]